MTKILTAIVFALSFGVLAATASAVEGTPHPGGQSAFPDYTTING